MLGELEVAVKEVAAVGAASLAVDELSEALVALRRQIDSLESSLARLGDECNTRRVWADTGARSGAAELARRVTGALRDVIKVRDRRCFHGSCDVRADRCQVDHIEPWAAGGMTSQDNGRLACGFHNRNRDRDRDRPPSRE